MISDGDGGMEAGNCPNRGESSPLNDTSKSLVLVNYFRTVPLKLLACGENSDDLIDMLYTCYTAAGNRFANFVAVDFYKVRLFLLRPLLNRALTEYHRSVFFSTRGNPDL